MVHRSVNGGHLVRALRKTARDVSIQLTLCVCLAVQTEEECEFCRVGGSGLRERFKSLNDDVGVTLNKTGGRIDLLGSGKIIGIWINKEPGLYSLDRQRHLEGGVCWDNS